MINIEPVELHDSGDSRDTDEYSDGEPIVPAQPAQFSINMARSQHRVRYREPSIPAQPAQL